MGTSLKVPILGEFCKRMQRSILGADALLLLQIWASGDVSHADDIMASNVKMHSLIEGNSMSGVDTFKSMVSDIFKVCPISFVIATNMHAHTAVMQASDFEGAMLMCILAC